MWSIFKSNSKEDKGSGTAPRTASEGERPTGTTAASSDNETPVARPRAITLTSSSKFRPLAAEFLVDDLYVSAVNQSILGISFGTRKLIVGSAGRPIAYSFSDIIEVELVRNGVTLTQTNRGSQLVGAAIGGAALGGVGALIGGVTGSSRSRERLAELSLKITVEDSAAPVHVVSLLSIKGKGMDPSSTKGRQAVSRVEQLHGMLLVAMRKSRADAPTGEGEHNVDKLERLWKLRESGAVTDEEFMAQKARILGGSAPEAQAQETPEEWDEKATVHIRSWNGKSPGTFLLGLRELLSVEDVLQLAGQAKKAPCEIKLGTPSDATRLKQLFASGGVDC